MTSSGLVNFTPDQIYNKLQLPQRERRRMEKLDVETWSHEVITQLVKNCPSDREAKQMILAVNMAIRSYRQQVENQRIQALYRMPSPSKLIH